MHKGIIEVLYISYDGLTDPLGQSQILPYLVGLTKKGYHFTIISAEKKKNYELNKPQIQSICDKHTIDWEPIAYTKNPPILSTLWDVNKIGKKAKQLHREKDFKIVHCRSYLSALIGLKMQQKFGTKFIFDMRGFWADERKDGNIWNTKKVHYKLVYDFFKKKESIFLKKADAIISLTDIGKKIMQEEWGVSNSIYVIPCAVNTNLFQPIENKTPNKSIVLGYLGTLGSWYLLDEMLDFYKVFLKYYPNSRFKFISKELPSFILDKAQAKGIDLSLFDIEAVERKDVPKALSNIDIGLFFIKPCFSKKSSSPVKQGEFMSMGIPVITNSGIGDTDQIIRKYKSGILVNDFSLSSYEKIVKDISKIFPCSSSSSIREGAIDYFGLQKHIEKYNAVYKTCLTHEIRK